MDSKKLYYSNSIILQGSEKDAGDEMNWLNWIPSGGTVVIAVSNNKVAYPKGTIITSLTDLPEDDCAWFTRFSKPIRMTEKNVHLTFISKMNPYIKVNSISEQSREGDKKKVTTVTYTAEKDKPILIPLIKFISD